MHRSPSPRLLAVLASAVALAAGPVPRAAQDADVVGPGPRPVDAFHPANQPTEEGGRPRQPEPAYGGRVIMHLESMPENFNRAIENSAVTREIHLFLHETLVRQDWESWEYVPNLAVSWDVEDMVVLVPGAAERYAGKTVRVPVMPAGSEQRTEADVVYGSAEPRGDGWVVTPASGGSPALDGRREGPAHALDGPLEIQAKDVASVEKGAVFTFHLRDDVIWHPSLVVEADGSIPADRKAMLQRHQFDAHDVWFSWNLYDNPNVDCDQVRFQFTKVTRADVVDDLTIRMFYQSQYYAALESIGIDMCMLPAHLYDLGDPDNPDYDAKADLAARATYINENPHNQQFVGLGPYRLTTVNQAYIEGTRFDDYFDDSQAGYFDVVRYRYIADDNAAFQALLNGELDFFYRVKSADYFGVATERPEFTSNFYKGYFYLGNYGFNVWNTFRESLSDPAVRKAIAHAFDFEDYKRTTYKGLCNQVTGPFPYNSLAYDHDVEPLPYDPDEAEIILDEAGWYDRNGDGVRDKDGVELQLEYLMPSGNDASKNFGLKLKESLERIGINLKIAQMEWATFSDRLQDREFDSANLAWMPALESDPEQVWHSKWGQRDERGSNYSGTRDAEVDRLIEAGQRELDPGKRQEIWHALHRRIYELQPYLFLYNVPRKFALNKKIRGFQSFAIRPGYYVRRWYYPKGTPGTRPTLRKAE